MIVHVQEMLNLIFGDMSAYAWYPALNDILIFIFCIIIIMLTYKFWKLLLGGWVKLWQ